MRKKVPMGKNKEKEMFRNEKNRKKDKDFYILSCFDGCSYCIYLPGGAPYKDVQCKKILVHNLLL